jgi:acyl-coenzyme A synthetase/AMP-(fatty) acid ligase
MNLFEAIFSPELLDRTAVLYAQRQISYGELREQTLSISRALSLLGILRGDRVALLLQDSPEFVKCFIAICSSGVIAVPINMGLGLDEQRAILNDCAASVAIVEAELWDASLVQAAEKLPHLRQVIVVNREEREQELATEADRTQNQRNEDSNSAVPSVRICSLSELLTECRQEPVPEFHSPLRHEPAFILYTSGSTGEPKGAVHRQSDILYTNETYCREVLKLGDGDRLFSSSRLPFAYGLGNAFSFPLLNGCTTILCREKPSPEVISRVFSESRPTIFFGVPVVYRLLLDHHKNVSSLDCSSLRLCISAGEALPAQIGEEWDKTFSVPVLDGIGSTEMLHKWISNHEGDVF